MQSGVLPLLERKKDICPDSKCIMRKIRNVTITVPKTFTPKQNYVHCIFIAWKTSNNLIHLVVFVFHQTWQTDKAATENASMHQAAKKRTVRMRNDIDFNLSKSTYGPQGFGGSEEKGYLFSGSWGYWLLF